MEIYNETELADDKLIWAGYTYVINGEPTVLILPEGEKKTTVAEYKKLAMVESIKNCDMKGRGLALKKAGA